MDFHHSSRDQPEIFADVQIEINEAGLNCTVCSLLLRFAADGKVRLVEELTNEYGGALVVLDQLDLYRSGRCCCQILKWNSFRFDPAQPFQLLGPIAPRTGTEGKGGEYTDFPSRSTLLA